MKNIFSGIKNRNKLKIGFYLLLLSGFIFSSCAKERLREDEAIFDGYGDIFIQKKKVDGEVLYAPYYYLHANSSMETANVETPDGEIVELEPYEFLDTYIREPAEEEFNSLMIATGTYYFKGSYGDNETFEITDIFNGANLSFPQIDSSAYDTTNYYIYVSWKTLNGADVYKIKLLNQSGRMVFEGPALTYESNVYGFDINTDGWTTTPYKGDIFTLQIHAFSLDDDANDNNWFHNIECNSYSETEIVWGG